MFEYNGTFWDLADGETSFELSNDDLVLILKEAAYKLSEYENSKNWKFTKQITLKNGDIVDAPIFALVNSAAEQLNDLSMKLEEVFKVIKRHEGTKRRLDRLTPDCPVSGGRTKPSNLCQ